MKPFLLPKITTHEESIESTKLNVLITPQINSGIEQKHIDQCFSTGVPRHGIILGVPPSLEIH
jgi:hypothetical protein